MNADEFGLPSEQELFEGEYRAKMQELREKGLTPWSTEDTLDARNAVLPSHPRWHNYIDTDFGIAGTGKHVFLLPDSPNLRAITSQTELTNG